MEGKYMTGLSSKGYELVGVVIAKECSGTSGSGGFSFGR